MKQTHPISNKNGIHKAELRNNIILYSVDRLKRFGFIHVNEKNIFEDEVYKTFFFRILLEKLGDDQELDALIKKMILEIES